jgi:hypothetical protein
MHNKFSFATLPIHNSVMNNVSEEGIEMGEQTAIPSAMAWWIIGSIDILRLAEMTQEKELKSICCALTLDETQGDVGIAGVARGKRRVCWA